MKTIEVINQVRGWAKDETVFIPNTFEGTFKCDVKWCGESKPKKDGLSTISCAFIAYEGTEAKGKYWLDATLIGKLEDGKFTYPESFIGEFKGGKLMQATAQD